MQDEHTHQEPIFPPKLILNENNNNSFLRSLTSLALFIGAFYLFFDWEISYILILVVVLLIHEAGHFIAMKAFNYKDVKMFFIPLLGALVSGNKQQISQKQRAIILLAGPVPGIVIGLLIYVFATENTPELIKTSANIFIFLNVFNLLPFSPLDGGNLVSTLFFDQKESIKKIFVIISAIGLALIAYWLESYILIVVPVFLLLGLRNQSKLIEVKENLDKAGIDYNKDFEDLSDREYWLIREEIVFNIMPLEDVATNKYVPSQNEISIQGQMRQLAIQKPIMDLSRSAKMGMLAIWLLFSVGVILGLVFGQTYRSLDSYTDAEYKKILVQSCLGDDTLQLEAMHAYCDCAMDTLMKRFSREELRSHTKLPEAEVEQLYEPLTEDCLNEMKFKQILEEYK